jgi:hypothetical protein
MARLTDIYIGIVPASGPYVSAHTDAGLIFLRQHTPRLPDGDPLGRYDVVFCTRKAAKLLAKSALASKLSVDLPAWAAP